MQSIINLPLTDTHGGGKGRAFLALAAVSARGSRRPRQQVHGEQAHLAHSQPGKSRFWGNNGKFKNKNCKAEREGRERESRWAPAYCDTPQPGENPAEVPQVGGRLRGLICCLPELEHAWGVSMECHPPCSVGHQVKYLPQMSPFENHFKTDENDTADFPLFQAKWNTNKKKEGRKRKCRRDILTICVTHIADKSFAVASNEF